MSICESDPRGEDLDRLRAELERQADIYRGLGVRKDVVMRLLVPRPGWLAKELTIPVVALGTSIPLEKQASFAGIEELPGYKHSYEEDVASGITFNTPHLIWMQDGSKYRYQTTERVRQNVKDERPSTVADGIALAIVYPKFETESQEPEEPGEPIEHDIKTEVLKDHRISFPGTSYQSRYVPYLCLDDDNTLMLSFRPFYFPLQGSATSGS